jgi:hypothetical protein
MLVPPTLGLTFGCGMCRAVNIVRCSDDVHSRHGLGAFVSGSLVKVSTQPQTYTQRPKMKAMAVQFSTQDCLLRTSAERQTITRLTQAESGRSFLARIGCVSKTLRRRSKSKSVWSHPTLPLLLPTLSAKVLTGNSKRNNLITCAFQHFLLSATAL